MIVQSQPVGHSEVAHRSFVVLWHVDGLAGVLTWWTTRQTSQTKNLHLLYRVQRTQRSSAVKPSCFRGQTLNNKLDRRPTLPEDTFHPHEWCSRPRLQDHLVLRGFVCMKEETEV